MSSTTLFEVPIISKHESDPSKGSIVATSPAPEVYLLSWNNPPDNRLTTSFLQSLLLALDIIEVNYPPGVLITTSSIAKFYSNGLNLEHVGQTPGFQEESLFPVFTRLATYPMPTIALFNGHAFAGALMVGMYHDYRVQNPSKGFLCLNELDFGVALSPAMSAIFKQKTVPATYRSLVLEAKRFPAKDALAAGIVDATGGLDEVLAFIAERKLTEKGKSGIYATMKAEMYRETLEIISATKQERERLEKLGVQEDEAKAGRKKRVAEWQKNTKAKL